MFKIIKNKQRANTIDSNRNELVKTTVFGVDITNSKIESVLEFVTYSLLNTQEQYFIVTPNPEIIVYAHHHPNFRKILNAAKIALCDGIGLLIGSNAMHSPLKEKISGVDFMEGLCEALSRKPITVGFLGGRIGVAKATADCLQRKYPGLKVGFAGEDPYEKGVSVNRKGESRKNADVSNLDAYPFTLYPKVDVLFVAFGFPKQEEWMFNNLGKSSIRVMMGVGGAFDYISGNVRRAPRFIRLLGLEWLFRLVVQPWRWKRQLALLEFIWLAAKEVRNKK